jgi:hypothetical protein
MMARGSARGHGEPAEVPRNAGLHGAALPTGEALARAIAEQPPAARDGFVDALLGMTPAFDGPEAVIAADRELINYVPSGVSAIADAIVKARVGRDDVLVDIGAGLGRVAVLVHLLTGARAVGIELQKELVDRARERVSQLGLGGVELLHGDAREMELPVGTVYFLYLPFVGRALAGVVERLARIAREREIAICSLGVDLKAERSLRVLDESSMWLTVYESRAAGGSPRKIERASVPSLEWIASERAMPAPGASLQEPGPRP